MRSFKDFVEKKDDQDPEMDLDEGALRNLGAAALFGRILSQSKRIKRSQDVGEKLDLISDLSVTLAGLTMAVGKFLEKSNR